MIIVISSKSGCGNSSVSKELAKKYNYAFINYTFRQYAQEHGLAFEQVHARAKQSSDIDRYIDERQIELAQKGDCVVGSRLSIWKIPNPDLRVYLTASLWIRAGRIAQREHISHLRSFFVTMIRDMRNHLRYKRYYHIDTNDYEFVDLIIDTSKNNIADVVDIICKKVDN